MRNRTIRMMAALAALQMAATGCHLAGPSCLARQNTGSVTSVSAQVEPAQVVSHEVPYDRQGSQNNTEIRWPGQGAVEGPRIAIYATSLNCLEFVPPALSDMSALDRGACTIIGRCGGSLAPDARACAVAGTCPVTGEDIVCRSMIVTGPGNGAPADFNRYKLHVVGDPVRPVGYSFSITWFSGPDC
jgi:hypothetical protein